MLGEVLIFLQRLWAANIPVCWYMFHRLGQYALLRVVERLWLESFTVDNRLGAVATQLTSDWWFLIALED